MKLSLNSKQKFIINFLCGFVYAGVTLYLATSKKDYIKSLFEGAHIFTVPVFLLILAATFANTIYLQNKQKSLIEHPEKIFGFLNAVIIETVLCSTIYIYFIGILYTSFLVNKISFLFSSNIVINIRQYRTELARVLRSQIFRQIV